MEALRARGLGVGCGHATWGGGKGRLMLDLIVGRRKDN